MWRQTSTLRHSNYCLHFYLWLSQAISQSKTTPSFSLHGLQCVRSLRTNQSSQSSTWTPSSLYAPFKVWAGYCYQTGTALTEKYPKEQDLSQRTSSEHQVVSGNSTLKGRLFQEAKDRSTGDNALGVGLFFFSFLASNQVWPVPSSRLLTGAER